MKKTHLNGGASMFKPKWKNALAFSLILSSSIMTQSFAANSLESIEAYKSIEEKLYQEVKENSQAAYITARNNKFNPNYKPKNAPSLGELAITKRQFAVLEILVDRGLNLDYKNDEGMSYSYFALFESAASAITILFKNISTEKQSAYLAEDRNLSIEKDHGLIFAVFIDGLDQNSLNRILDYLVYNLKVKCSVVARKYGGTLNFYDENGKTSLHYAVENEDLERIHMNILFGADPNIEIKGTRTNAFDLAKNSKNKSEVLRLLNDE